MICPLLLMKPMEEDVDEMDIGCIEKECAWWIDGNPEIGTPSACSLNRLALSLGEIQWQLSQIQQIIRNRG